MTNETNIPSQLVAGDSWAWSDAPAFASHPPPDWSLHYILRPVTGGDPITIVASHGETSFVITHPASETQSLAPGEYEWSALAFNAGTGDRARLSVGRICILPDPLQATGDQRSGAERILAAIDATLEGRVSKDAESYTIEGRSIARTPIEDLTRLQSIYSQRVAQERNPGGSPIQYRRVSF
ncbi:hypothetical protein GFB49_11605 [Epibacterium sp. SM1979]|uniref:Uncharacterized protein n=1 Tax=Tritonibacter litoralis TaxID=2662264 RepID=A0A843YIL2_9RHOB|nr:hypothetical protein [Tritonibacter litoralis]MQQ09102.1 hypothetical protein [Tritonibacter litoralis]